MYEKWRKIFKPEASLFVGVLFVGLLGFLRPFQKDFAHVVGVLTMGGGRAFHPAHLELGKDLFGQNTIFISAGIAGPIQGDIAVTLVGPETLDYTVSSRYPPGVPLRNRTHPWYRFEAGTLKGVYPGDDVAIVVTVRPPASPGAYELILTDTRTGQTYLNVPVLFEQPGAGTHAGALPEGGQPGNLAPGNQKEESTDSGTDDCH